MVASLLLLPKVGGVGDEMGEHVDDLEPRPDRGSWPIGREGDAAYTSHRHTNFDASTAGSVYGEAREAQAGQAGRETTPKRMVVVAGGFGSPRCLIRA